MATVVGFLDLNKQLESLSSSIETKLRNSWLDHETAFTFKKRFYWARSKNDVKILQAVYDDINKEILGRQRAYGVRRI